MSRAPARIREQARRLFLTSQLTTNAQIASYLHLKPHTVGRWRKAEDWDSQKLQIEQAVAEKTRQQLATERTALNLKHFRFWEILMSRVAEALQQPDFDKVRVLTRLAAVIERAQKGQRLARGLNLDGQTEELIRATAQAENRTLANLLLDIVKEHVTDEATRDRIVDAIAQAASEKDRPEAENLPGADSR